MKIAAVIVLLFFAGILGTELYTLFREGRSLRSEVETLTAHLNTLAQENATLRADILYFSNPDNLEKELRAKWNYKKPNENLIIIPQSSSQNQ